MVSRSSLARSRNCGHGSRRSVARENITKQDRWWQVGPGIHQRVAQLRVARQNESRAAILQHRREFASGLAMVQRTTTTASAMSARSAAIQRMEFAATRPHRSPDLIPVERSQMACSFDKNTAIPRQFWIRTVRHALRGAQSTLRAL